MTIPITIDPSDLPPVLQNIIEPMHKIVEKTTEITKLRLAGQFEINATYNVQLPNFNPNEPFSMVLPAPVIGPNGLVFVPQPVDFIPAYQNPMVAQSGVSETLNQESGMEREFYGYSESGQAHSSRHRKNYPDTVVPPCKKFPQNSILNEKSSNTAIHKKSEMSLELLCKIYSVSVAKAVVYLEGVNEQICKALDEMRKVSPKDLGQMVLKLEDMKESYSQLVRSLRRLQNEGFNYEIDTHPEFIQLKEVSKKIISNYNQITYNKLRKYFTEENLTITPDHLLCTVLGLNQSVAGHLLGIDLEVKCHQSWEYWISLYLDRNEPAESTTDLENDFQQLGFVPERAKYLSSSLHDNPMKDHISSLQWAKRYIESLFNYNVLLSNCSDLPFSYDIGEEFEIPIEYENGISHNSNSNDPNETENSKKCNGIFLNHSNYFEHIRIHDYIPSQGAKLNGNLNVSKHRIFQNNTLNILGIFESI